MPIVTVVSATLTQSTCSNTTNMIFICHAKLLNKQALQLPPIRKWNAHKETSFQLPVKFVLMLTSLSLQHVWESPCLQVLKETKLWSYFCCGNRRIVEIIQRLSCLFA